MKLKKEQKGTTTGYSQEYIKKCQMAKPFFRIMKKHDRNKSFVELSS